MFGHQNGESPRGLTVSSLDPPTAFPITIENSMVVIETRS